MNDGAAEDAQKPIWARRLALVRAPEAAEPLRAAVVIALIGCLRGGMAPVYLGGAGVLVALLLIGPQGVRWAKATGPFFLAVVAYDLFGLIAHLRGEVLVAGPYELERSLFGVLDGDRVVVLAEFFASRTNIAADVVFGAAYAVYLYFVPGMSIVLLALGRDRPVRVLGLAFLATHLVAFAIWLALPVAPPWYVMEYGFGPAKLDVPGNAAGAARFDALFGIRYFEKFYAQSRNPFGALPSLHVAYPVLLVATVFREHPAFRVVAGVLLAAVAAAAIYLCHHYVIDLLAGAGVALVSFAGASWWVTNRTRTPAVGPQ